MVGLNHMSKEEKNSDLGTIYGIEHTYMYAHTCVLTYGMKY